MQKWKLVSIPFNAAIHDAMLQQHHALQFLTKTTKAFIATEPDDSHINVGYDNTLHAFLGRNLEGEIPVSLGLRLTDLSLLLISDKIHIIDEIKLDGKSKDEVLIDLQRKISSLGYDGQKIKNELHYSIPEHKLSDGGLFDANNHVGFLENDNYRNNAHLVFNKIATQFPETSEIRVWPHHFDTGGLIPLNFNAKNELTRSIGIGFAIPDSMLTEPYFYISYWSANPNKKDLALPAFKGAGKWKIPQWNGAILPIFELVQLKKTDEQFQMLTQFFSEGIEALRNLGKV